MKLKIAIFTNSLAGGGMERLSLDLANHFYKQGVHVDFLVASNKGELQDEAKNVVNLINLKNNKSIRLWLFKATFFLEPLLIRVLLMRKLPKAVKVIPGLVEYMKIHSPDVVISMPTTANLALLWASSASHMKTKIVIHEVTNLSNELKNNDSPFFSMVSIFVNKWYRKAENVICVSQGVLNDLRDNFRVPQKKLTFIPNIMDLSKIIQKAKSVEHDHMLREWSPFILAAGRLESVKNYSMLIKAFSLIANNTDRNLIILGEGSEREKLEKMIVDLSLKNRIFMPGFISNPYPFMRCSDVFVLSSNYEGAPNVLREAVLLNKKIVSTNCPSGPKEILSNLRQCRLVEVGDYEGMSESLLSMIESEEVMDSEERSLSEINNKSKLLYNQICLHSSNV